MLDPDPDEMNADPQPCLVIVVDEEVLALVLVGHVGAGRGRRRVGGRLQGLGALRHRGGQAARGLVTRILTTKRLVRNRV